MLHRRFVRRFDKGFTLIELLGALAVMAVLAGVVFPAGISVKKSLDMTRLDADAKQIYVVAQNSLVSVQSSGRTDSLVTELAANSERLTAKPTDYPSDDSSSDGNWAKCSVYYVTSANDTCSDDNGSASITTGYLITSSGDFYTSSALSGQYVIELSPTTGEVYGVFYWESGESLSYSNIISKIGDRSRDARMDTGIGYYGGRELSDAVVSNSEKSSFEDTKVSIVNDEELYVKMENPAFGQAAADGKLDDLTVTLKVTGDHGWYPTTATKTLVYSGSSLGINTTTNEVDVILDSMRDNLSFYDIIDGAYDSTGKLTGHLSTGNPNWIYPGSSITVDVTISYDKDYAFNDFQTSSLYGSYDSSTKAVTVSALRHLNNLRLSKRASDLDGKNVISSVVIDKDIDFDGQDWTNTCVSIQSRVDGVASGMAYNPLTSFAPLCDYTDTSGARTGVFWASGGTGTVDGESHLLKNFVISDGYGSVGGTGIFGSIKNASLSNIFVVDPIVTGSQNTGALVGIMNGGASSIKNCGVYLTGDYSTRTVTGSTDVGGLVGNQSGNFITGSFAAIDVIGTENVGGLIGYTSGGAGDSKCYSSGDVTAMGSRAGGFVGWNSGGRSISDCYTTSDVFCDRYAGAFAGYMSSSGSFDDIAYGRARKCDGTVDSDFTATTNGFCGSDSDLKWPDGSLVFLQMHGYNDQVTASRFTAESYSTLKVANAYTASTSHPYAMSLQGEAFPFANTCGLGTHYGNWPVAVTISFYDNADGNKLVDSYEMLSGDTPTLAIDYSGITSSGSARIPSSGQNLSFGSVTRDTSYSIAYIQKVQPLAMVASSVTSLYIGSSTQIASESGDAKAWSINSDLISALYGSTSACAWGDVDLSWQMNRTTDGSFVFFMSNKFSGYAGGSRDGPTVNVIEYDAGRAAAEKPAYRVGTIKLVGTSSNGQSYYVYDPSSFSPDGDWFTPTS